MPIILATAGLTGCTADCNTGTTAFWSSGTGHLIGAVLAVVGVLVVLMSLAKMASKIAAGKTNEAVKILIGTVVIAAFMFNPSLLQNLIGTAGSIIKTVIDSLGSIVSSSSNSGTTPGS